MSKKFFDIISPSKKESLSEKPDIDAEEQELKLEIKIPSENLKTEEKNVPINDLEKINPEKKEQGIKEQKKKIRPKRIFLKSIIFILFCLFAVSISGYFMFTKTEVEIWPKTDILTLKETIIIDVNKDQIDFSAKIIPGKIFQDQESVLQEFSATGKISKEVRAKGIIRVYNAYSDSPQILLTNTRFVSSDGKLFRSIKREVIPGGKYERGKLVPSFIDIEVQAAKAGEDYNIGPTTFSIPGFIGTPKYTAFYGKSSEPMVGGFRGEVSQVTSEDLENSKNILVNKLKEEGKNSLKNTIPEDFVLLDETVSQEIIKEDSSVEAESEAESFNFQLEMKSEGLAFRKSDMDGLTKNIIGLNVPEGKRFQEESVQVNSSIKNKEAGKIIMNLEIKMKIYPDFDLTKIKRALAGKSFQEITMFLDDDPLITRIEVKSSPFLRKKIPQNIDKLEIIINLGPLPI